MTRTTLLTLCLLAMLPLLGPASAVAETFRIELDYMVESGAGGHSHQPSQAVIDAVVNMFACAGHTLIVDVDDAIPHHEVLQLDPSNSNNFFGYSGTSDSFGSLRSAYYDRSGQSGWHYAIFAHRYEWVDSGGNYFDSFSSGLGQISGIYFLVTLGTFDSEVGTAFDQASTLAHEFGHNLGLTHCGGMQCNDSSLGTWVNPNVPNLASVMSYFFQLEGIHSYLTCQGLAPSMVPFRDLDYSRGTMCTLDENGMDETLGTLMSRVDWDCDGTIGGTASQDLRGSSLNCPSGGTLTVLSDYDEWTNISDPAKWASKEDLDAARMVACITSEEAEAVREKMACVRPALVTEACQTAETRYVRNSGNPVATGRCEDAFSSIHDAYGSAPAGSIIFVEPGTFTGGAQVIGNARQVIITSVGSAVIR